MNQLFHEKFWHTRACCQRTRESGVGFGTEQLPFHRYTLVYVNEAHEVYIAEIHFFVVFLQQLMRFIKNKNSGARNDTGNDTKQKNTKNTTADY